MEKEMDLSDLERVLAGKGSQFERWEWRIKGTDTVHHPTGRAIEWSDGDWAWYWVNRPHRWDGPARFVEGRYEYWIHGSILTREEWEHHPRRLEWLKTNKLGGI